MEITHEKDMEGNIIRVLPRKNELVRPAVANIDQALVVFAVTKPKPHFNLLDRFPCHDGDKRDPGSALL